MRVGFGRTVCFAGQKDAPMTVGAYLPVALLNPGSAQAAPDANELGVTLVELMAMRRLICIRAKTSKRQRVSDLVNLVMGSNFVNCHESFKSAVYEALVGEMGGCNKSQAGKLNLLLSQNWTHIPIQRKQPWVQWLLQCLFGMAEKSSGSRKQEQMLH